MDKQSLIDYYSNVEAKTRPSFSDADLILIKEVLSEGGLSASQYALLKSDMLLSEHIFSRIDKMLSYVVTTHDQKLFESVLYKFGVKVKKHVGSDRLRDVFKILSDIAKRPDLSAPNPSPVSEFLSVAMQRARKKIPKAVPESAHLQFLRDRLRIAQAQF